MMTTGPVALGLAAVAAMALSQWLLAPVRFSSMNAEWVFRGLYLGAHLATAAACATLGHRARGRTWAGLLLIAPAVLSLLLQWQASSGRDGQAAILLLLLPILQLLATAVVALAVRLLVSGSRR